MTMIDRERIIMLQKFVSESMQKYRDEYTALKSNISSDLEDSFWCKGWREAYAPDFVNEIADNTQEARKILPKEPRRKTYTSLHCYFEKKPVISLFYGNEEKTCMEKFFTEVDNMIVGICYTTNEGSIYSLSIETRNPDGLPCEYTVCYPDMNYKDIKERRYLLRSAEYYFDEHDRITSASYFDRAELNADSPDILEDYTFIYENGTVTDFTRINYSKSIEKKAENTWKFDRWILKRYKDDGISYFG